MQMKINKHAVSKEAELETAIRDAYPKGFTDIWINMRNRESC